MSPEEELGQPHRAIHEFQYAVRSLRRQPAFATTTLLVLTLGIGVTTAALSVLNAYVLRPLPMPEPDRLLAIVAPPFDEVRPPAGWETVDWSREFGDLFEHIIVTEADAFTVVGEPHAEMLMGAGSALGARRGRLAQHLLGESLLLAVAGSALGLVLASVALDGIGVSIQQQLRTEVADAILDNVRRFCDELQRRDTRHLPRRTSSRMKQVLRPGRCPPSGVRQNRQRTLAKQSPPAVERLGGLRRSFASKPGVA